MVKQEEKQREGLTAKPMISTIFNTYTNNSTSFTSSNSSAPRYNTPRQQNNFNPNAGSDRRNGSNPNSVIERRSNFKKGVYYGNCGKEGHFQEECYKIIGYPVGYPLHGKYQPPKRVHKTTRTVNMVVGQEDSKSQASSSQASDTHVSARIDQLQNQLNQVKLMLQNNQGNISQDISKLA